MFVYSCTAMSNLKGLTNTKKCARLIFWLQVINYDDVERILGARPFASDVVRNIDRYRYGGDGTKPAALEVCAMRQCCVQHRPLQI